MVGNRCQRQHLLRPLLAGRRWTAVTAVVASLLLTLLASAQSAQPISFGTIASAQRSLSVDLRQIRTVFDGGSQGSAGSWIGIKERLQVLGRTGRDPRFRLEFDGIVGKPLTEADLAARRDIYWSYAGYLFEHGGFRVNDAATADQNYLLFYLDSDTRLNRPIRRYAVMSRVFGRTSWLIDVDVATSYPLYTAEFNAAGQLVSALEVTDFRLLAPGKFDLVEWWEPLKVVQEFPTVGEALTSLPSVFLPIPTAADLPAGYSLTSQQVVRSDVNSRESLVLTYSDGIDEFFVVFTLNSPRPALPAVPLGENETPYAIVLYQDLSVTQLLFHVDGLEAMVIGRASQFYLASLARNLLVRTVQAE
jgi:hypothetical protein